VRTIGISGTGLGLYVCRKFIEGHNGRVWAHSEGLGKGSEFGFWIPLDSKEHAQNREYQLHAA
jgi:two-component system CheB/CheR fusion protein